MQDVRFRGVFARGPEALRRGAITDLHPLGATWSRGFGVNELGEIVGVTGAAAWTWRFDPAPVNLPFPTGAG